MKILLIVPPEKNMIVSNTPSIVDEEQGFFPHLGVMYMASFLRENTDHKVRILDTIVNRYDYKDIERELTKYNPDVVGIPALTFNIIDTLKVAALSKKVNNECKIILGGPHVNLFPNETITQKNIDFLVLGEGEITFTELVDSLNNKTPLKKVKGVVFKEGGKIIKTEPRPLINDLDNLPFPARDLTQYKKYYSLLAKRSPITTMFTSRGCPYKCVFCDRPHLGKVFRARSAENVFEEMKECVRMGIHEIAIYDDTFTVDKKRVNDLCNLIIKNKLDVSWDIRARVDTIDKGLLRLLYKAGCERIHFGVEAGTQKILNNLRKGITIEQVTKAFRWSRQVGITTLAYFIIGSPGETLKEINQTFNFALKIRPDYLHLSAMTPFPGTELYRVGLQKGIIKKDYWKEFASNPSKDFKAPFWTENLSEKQLAHLLIKGYKKFYTRPSYIIKSLLKIRTFEEFKKKAKAGIKVISMR